MIPHSRFFPVLWALTTLSLPLAPNDAAAKPKKRPAESSQKKAPVKYEDFDSAFKAFDCPFLVRLSHPKDPLAHPLGFCMYTHTEERGIFAASACVGVLVEPLTQTKNPFYGSRGHWGLEGKCDAEMIKKKFHDKEIDVTVNPITDIRQKRKDGVSLKKLRDDYGLWELFEKITTPR